MQHSSNSFPPLSCSADFLPFLIDQIISKYQQDYQEGSVKEETWLLLRSKNRFLLFIYYQIFAGWRFWRCECNGLNFSFQTEYQIEIQLLTLFYFYFTHFQTALTFIQRKDWHLKLKLWASKLMWQYQNECQNSSQQFCNG